MSLIKVWFIDIIKNEAVDISKKFHAVQFIACCESVVVADLSDAQT